MTAYNFLRSRNVGYLLGMLRVSAERAADLQQPAIARQLEDLHDDFLALAIEQSQNGQLCDAAFLDCYQIGYGRHNQAMTFHEAHDVFQFAANNLLTVLAA